MPTDRYQLAPIQQGMLFHWLLDRHSGTDVEQIVAALNEPIDPLRLEYAWQSALDSFSTLRTAFSWEGLATPLQHIEARTRIQVAFRDLRSLSTEEREAHVTSYLQADRRNGFDLATAPAMRVALFQMDKAQFRMAWSFHHILIDGRAFELILNHVFAAYESGETPAASDRPYREYINWVTQQDQSSDREFWRDRLAGFTATTPLPFDQARDSTSGFDQRDTVLPAATTAKLRELAIREDLSLNTIVMSAWAFLLARYSGESDIVFGATKTTRRGTIPDADSMAGLFLATIPVRISVPLNTPVRDWLKQMRAEWVSLRGHEHLPLVDIKKVSELPSTASLFDTLVVFENYKFATRLRNQGGRWATRDFSLLEQTGFPLTFLAYADDALALRLEFDASRFQAATIDRMLAEISCILTAWSSDVSIPVWETPMLTESERQQILVDWNATEMEYPRDVPLAKLIEDQVERAPDAIAVGFGEQQLSYRQLNERANRLAHELVKHGIGPNALVGVCLERSPDMLVALLAVVKSGGGYVALDPSFPPDRLGDMADDAELQVLLTEPAIESRIKGFGGNVVYLSHAEWTSNSATNLAVSVKSEDLAYVIYTSGTTGKPKGVEVSRGGFINFLCSMSKTPGIRETDRLVAVTTISFDIAGLELFLPLITGACVVLASRETAADGIALRQLIEGTGATILQATPITWRLLFEAGWKGHGNLTALCGGEAMPPELIEPLTSACGSVWNMYGPTETTVWSSIYQIRATDKSISIGRPIANTSMYILDRYLQPAPIGATGELYIGGVGVARGYLNRPDLTVEKFVPDPFRPGQKMYRTGDLARYHSDGNIECLGRTDNQVKIRGFRIELGEIESLLKQRPDIAQAVVIAREDTPGDRRLVAYVVPELAGGEPISATELRAYLKETLPDYMLPTAFVSMGGIPLTANGKTDRRALPEPNETQLGAQQGAYVAPRTAVEEQLATIWSEVLKRDHIGINDNFFDLGGHSLLAMQVVGRIRDRLGFDMPLHHFFESPTIAAIATATKEFDAASSDESELLRLIAEIEAMPDGEGQSQS